METQILHLTWKYKASITETHRIARIHARIQKVLSEGAHFFFSLMRGGRIQIPLLAGHQRPASEMPFKLNAGWVVL